MIEKVGVLGSGTMGHGIAELCAIAGFRVFLYDIDGQLLERAISNIEKSLGRMRGKGVFDNDPDEITSRILCTTRITDLSNADLVIEAVTEDADIKKGVFGEANSVISGDCIFCTNTSTIPVSELAAVTSREDRFIGLHFFNPPVLMPLVEIIMGAGTSEETYTAVANLALRLNKTSIRVNSDIPGFVVNRLNDRMINESMKMVSEGIAPDLLDAALKFRMGLPMGICELLDYVGIDTAYLAGKEMRSRGFGGSDTPLLESMYRNGKLGIKSGKGFYTYDLRGKRTDTQILPHDEMYGVNLMRLISVVVNESAWLVRNKIATAGDIDMAMKKGMNWPSGPLEISDRIGVKAITSFLGKVASGDGEYSPDHMLVEMSGQEIAGGLAGGTFHTNDGKVIQFGPVSYEETSKRAHITIRRPEKLNALNTETWKGLREALEAASESPEVKVVILSGEGRAFSAGDDIDMMKNWSKEDASDWMRDYADPLVRVMLNFTKPVIGAIDGIAAGGGCELVMLCDIVVATNRSVFSIPEGLIGAMPPLASSLGAGLFDRRILRYALTGEKFTAIKAMHLGIVDVLTDRDQFSYTVDELATKVEKLAPLSARSIKTTFNLVRTRHSDALEHGKGELVDLAGTRDFMEGQRSFVEKRKPEWKGE